MITQFGFSLFKGYRWKLFLIISFPIHFWAWIVWFAELENMSQRTNTWDAFGIGSYFFGYALVESIIVFGIFSVLMFFLPKKIDAQNAYPIISISYLIFAAWVMLKQARFLPFFTEEVWFFKRIQNIDSIKSKIGIITLVTFSLSMIIPPILIIFFEKFKALGITFLERLEILSVIYLTLDIIAVCVIIIRNIS